MDKQKLIIVLLVVAIVFSVVSFIVSLSLSNLGNLELKRPAGVVGIQGGELRITVDKPAGVPEGYSGGEK